jgi:hypothetical protein
MGVGGAHDGDVVPLGTQVVPHQLQQVVTVAGIVVAVGAFFTIYWRRAKKKVQDKLGIDENANKASEDSSDDKELINEKKDKEIKYMDLEKECKQEQVEKYLKLEEIKEEKNLVHKFFLAR